MRPPRSPSRGIVLVLLLALSALIFWAATPVPSRGADAGTLQQEIDRGRARERTLASAAQQLGRLAGDAQRSVDSMRGRLTDAQARVSRSEGALAQTRADLEAARRRALRLRERLDRDSATLAANLRASYVAGRPDLVSVMLNSRGFAQLIDRMEFVKRAQQRNAQIVGAVRRGRTAALGARRHLALLLPGREQLVAQLRVERDAALQMAAALERRQATLERARSARLQALSSTKADRRRAERALTRLQQQQRSAAVDMRGPGGPWAIPWVVVQCESGGQNLPPNAAGASGYYQFIPSTWQALGGSTPNAYQASKAEQDRLAARLWAGGSGARNWDCAGIVGII
ncbi:unannotated protein [freshwater metagenome]|uniref:Unannotated protein n=1 Tax=freshwater metagenome TaxID=449393 RepID=A0A6J7DFU0_9ZZZZ|nr:hypothetical protein [Actinomycetota bacterium]